jgi:hypothetical protein
MTSTTLTTVYLLTIPLTAAGGGPATAVKDLIASGMLAFPR